MLRRYVTAVVARPKLVIAAVVAVTLFLGFFIGRLRLLLDVDQQLPPGHEYVVVGQRMLDELAENGFTIPADAKRSTTLAYLAEVCSAIEDRAHAHRLYELLRAYKGRTITAGVSTVCLGAADRFLGLLATVLAAIGLYGVMSYTVSRRTREIGIRIALGAERPMVVWLVLKEVALLTVVGIALGLPGALGLSQLVRSQLFGIEPTDPLTLTMAATTLALVGLLAGYLPARRAASVQPVRALRYE